MIYCYHNVIFIWFTFWLTVMQCELKGAAAAPRRIVAGRRRGTQYPARKRVLSRLDLQSALKTASHLMIEIPQTSLRAQREAHDHPGRASTRFRMLQQRDGTILRPAGAVRHRCLRLTTHERCPPKAIASHSGRALPRRSACLRRNCGWRQVYRHRPGRSPDDR